MIAEINGKVRSSLRKTHPPFHSRRADTETPAGMVGLELRDGAHKAEISYLAGGLTWSSDYVAVLNAEDTKLDLTGWVTLTNNSGTTFSDAGLKLVAGDVNVVQEQFAGAMRMDKTMMVQSEEAPQFKQSELFEYKLYALQRRTDIRNNETKQVETRRRKSGAVQKSVHLRRTFPDLWRMWFNNYSYRSQSSFDSSPIPKSRVRETFKNERRADSEYHCPRGRCACINAIRTAKEQFIERIRSNHAER